MNGNWQEVGRSIERLRDERGWTQTELSERSGVSVATIRNTEHARGKRSRRTMEDLSRAFGRPKDHLREILVGRQPGDRLEAGVPRRRVTEIPREDIDWFAQHGLVADADAAWELARAELTARRDGYIIRWVRPWHCQILPAADELGLLADSGYVFLDQTPDRDPAALLIEQRLEHEAELLGPDSPWQPSHVPGSTCPKYTIDRGDYLITWVQPWVCQLLEPDGATLIDQSDGWSFANPQTHPRARWLAAHMALEAGI
jgi:transcriptional regulator with XRE-family HTH domain